MSYSKHILFLKQLPAKVCSGNRKPIWAEYDILICKLLTSYFHWRNPLRPNSNFWSFLESKICLYSNTFSSVYCDMLLPTAQSSPSWGVGSPKIISSPAILSVSLWKHVSMYWSTLSPFLPHLFGLNMQRAGLSKWTCCYRTCPASVDMIKLSDPQQG